MLKDNLQSTGHAGLTGVFDVPGDKSVSHRSLIFGGLAIGTTRIRGLLEGDDVMATGRAMQALGADIRRDEDGVWHVTGAGTNGLVSPEAPLDLGNSGTGVRLLMGVVAGQPITATFCGDASLSRRPMARVTDPLARMGAAITARDGDRLPVTITGAETPLAADHVRLVACTYKIGGSAGCDKRPHQHRSGTDGVARPHRSHAPPFWRNRPVGNGRRRDPRGRA